MTEQNQGVNSVTLWLKELKQGSGAAANELWERYFMQLVSLAKAKLGHAPKRVSDEEDVALDVFHSLCEGAEQGRFAKLQDRDDLWRLLIAMTRHKAANQIRHQNTQKRGGSQVRGLSIVANGGTADGISLDVFLGDDPTPEFLLEVQEEQERLLDLLPDKILRNLAILRLQGYSVDEAAEHLGISSRGVKRKLALIREAWVVELQENR